MTLKRAFNLLFCILCFFPIEACHHHTEDFLEEIEMQDTTYCNSDSLNSIRPSENPSDTTNTVTTDLSFFNSDTIIVGHWNIGNFSLGKSSTTSISAAKAKDFAKKYHTFLDSLNIDILGICEYDPTFSNGKEKAQEIIFNYFPFFHIGKKYSYNCNAVFTTRKLNNNQDYLFPERVQTRYYTKSTININGKNIIFIETHLDWNQGVNGANYRHIQIKKLVETFRDSPYIILCADFNISSLEEFQPFIDAGFTLSNGGKQGSFNTYPATKPSSPIDNIIVKGFNVLDVKVIGDENLSDHLLIKGILKLIK